MRVKNADGHYSQVADPNSFALLAAEAIKTKRSHDAEIALRMQSLRAKSTNGSNNSGGSSPRISTTNSRSSSAPRHGSSRQTPHNSSQRPTLQTIHSRKNMRVLSDSRGPIPINSDEDVLDLSMSGTNRSLDTTDLFDNNSVALKKSLVVTDEDIIEDEDYRDEGHQSVDSRDIHVHPAAQAIKQSDASIESLQKVGKTNKENRRISDHRGPIPSSDELHQLPPSSSDVCLDGNETSEQEMYSNSLLDINDRTSDPYKGGEVKSSYNDGGEGYYDYDNNNIRKSDPLPSSRDELASYDNSRGEEHTHYDSNVAVNDPIPPSSSNNKETKDRKNRKKGKSRRSTLDSGHVSSSIKSKSSSRRHRKDTENRKGHHSQNDDGSAALVLYQDREVAMVSSSQSVGGGGGYTNYQLENEVQAALEREMHVQTTAATQYYSGVSKYTAVDHTKRSTSTSKVVRSNHGELNRGHRRSSSEAPKPSRTSGSRRHGKHKSGLQSSTSDFSTVSKASSEAHKSSRKKSTRSRSEVPREKDNTNKERSHRSKHKTGASDRHEKKHRRSNSEQPNHHKLGKKTSSRRYASAQRTQSFRHPSHGDRIPDPPPQPISSDPAPLDRKALMETLRAEQYSYRTQEPPAGVALNNNDETGLASQVNDSLFDRRFTSDDSNDDRRFSNDTAANDSTGTPQVESGGWDPSIIRGAVSSMPVSSPVQVEAETVPKDNITSYNESLTISGVFGSSRRLSDETNNASNHQPKETKTRQRAATEGNAPQDQHHNVSFLHDTKNNGNSHTGSQEQEQEQQQQSSPSPQSPSTPQSFGHSLANLSMLDRLDGSTGGKKLDSSSGRSVISRLSRRIKSRSVSSNDICGTRSVGGASSLHSGYFSRDSDHKNESPLKIMGSIGGSEYGVQRRRSMVSRMSNFGSSPRQSIKRLATTDGLDYHDNENETDMISQSLREFGPTESNDEVDVSRGIELHMDSDEVPRLCDDRGRCVFHPHLRLQKKKAFGGWKILYQHCPDCAVEHMKKTQEKLAAIQKQKKEEHRKRKLERKKKRIAEKEKNQREKEKHVDPIIGKDVGDQDFTVSEDKAKKKRSRKKKEKERIKKELAASRLASLQAPTPVYDDEIDDNNEKDKVVDDQPQQEDEEEDDDHEQQDQPPHHQPPSPREDRPQQDQPQQEEDPPEETNEEIIADDQTLALVPQPKQPMRKKVNGLPWSDYNGHSGRYTGEVNEQFLPHGNGEMVYDSGMKSTGYWYNGVLDTDGSGGDGGDDGQQIDGDQTKLAETYIPDTLPHYSIGDRGNEDDMIIDSKKATAALVAEIRANDAAFVRRSDGSWTYAVVKDRTYGETETIRFKVNVRGSTKAFPISQWGTYVRRVKKRDNPKPSMSLGSFLDNNKGVRRVANSVAGDLMRKHSSDVSVGSAQSAPVAHRSVHNLTTAKMKIRTRSRSRSRNRKGNITTLPLLFSSSMSVSEENEGHDNDNWETASGSGYRLRGIDP